MFKIIVCCDVCKKEIPIKKIETPIGKIEVPDVGKTEVVDTSFAYQHLCKECALEIDNQLLKAETEFFELLKQK